MRGIESFLSEESISLHKEYCRTLKAKYAILEKSFPCIEGKDVKTISKMKIDRASKNEILKLKAEVACHDVFFDSFGGRYQDSEIIRAQYGAIPTFFNTLSEIAMGVPHGFLIINERREEFGIYCGNDYVNVIANAKPYLAIDLCEHAYFMDYSFDKRSYILNALSVLDLNKLR